MLSDNPPLHSDEWLTVYQGDARTVMAGMEPESVHCVVTSPPYWGLRDYGDAGQLGLEPTPEEYVANLVDVFREVRRVLRSDGTVWLNLGDSYANTGGMTGGTTSKEHGRRADRMFDGAYRPLSAGLKQKDLVGIPWRVAFALQADGWYLRSDIIWAKPNPMPESVTDRPTKSHEYLFLLSKSPRYYFDADAVREPAETAGEIRGGGHKASTEGIHGGRDDGQRLAVLGTKPTAAGRNIRSVWTIATTPYGTASLPNRVGPDGIPGTVSPDCRVHSPRVTRGTGQTGEGDGRLDPDPSSSRDTDARLAPELAAVPLASSSPDSRDDHPATPGFDSLGSSDSPTPGSAPASRTPSPLTAGDGQGANGQPEPRTSHSRGSATSRDADVLWALDEGAAIGRNEPASRTSGPFVVPDSTPREPSSRRQDIDAQSEAGEAQCSCPKYISTSHFATFPRKLVEPCIKAGTSERGVCPECGAPWVRVVERERTDSRPGIDVKLREITQGNAAATGRAGDYASATTGWQPSCAHDTDPIPATCLDPFAGSGTTGLVAQSLSRRAILVDLSADYLMQALGRNRDIPLGLVS